MSNSELEAELRRAKRQGYLATVIAFVLGSGGVIGAVKLWYPTPHESATAHADIDQKDVEVRIGAYEARIRALQAELERAQKAGETKQAEETAKALTDANQNLAREMDEVLKRLEELKNNGVDWYSQFGPPTADQALNVARGIRDRLSPR